MRQPLTSYLGDLVPLTGISAGIALTFGWIGFVGYESFRLLAALW